MTGQRFPALGPICDGAPPQARGEMVASPRADQGVRDALDVAFDARRALPQDIVRLLERLD